MMRFVPLGVAVSVALVVVGGCPPEPPADSTESLDLTPQASAHLAGDKAEPGEKVALTARLAGDVESGSVTYRWFQTYGRVVEIDDADSPEATFVAPSLPEWLTDTGRTLRFRVDVVGPDGMIHSGTSSTVEVVVAPDPDYQPGDGTGTGGASDDAAESFEEQALEGGQAELAKSDGVRAQEFADLVASGADAAGNELQETASGLQYVIVKAGDGDQPGKSDTARVHYSGWLFDDGSLFDSSIERGEPSQFSVAGVIAGWTEGLQLMRVGSHYRLVIPSELGYGEGGKPPEIPGGATLVFDVYLLEIVR